MIDSNDNFENSEPIKINNNKAKQVFTELNKTDTISSTFELYINILFDGSNIKYDSNYNKFLSLLNMFLQLTIY